MSYADDLATELGAVEKARSGPAPRRDFGESVFSIANAIPTTQVLDRLGVSHDGEKFADCPGCDEPKALLCKNGGLRCMHNRCSHVGPSGHPGFRTNVDIVAERERVKPLDAARTLCGWFGIDVPRPKTNGHLQAPPLDVEWNPTDADAPDAPPSDASASVWVTLDVPAIFAPLEPIKHLVAPLDLCPGAPALFAGYGYSRKTLSAQAMSLAVAAGQSVWGCFSARQGRVLHVDYEQGARLTRERYQRLALGMDLGPSDLGDRLALVSMPHVYLDGGTLEGFLVERFAGFDLAIIDSFRAACPSIEENDSSARLVLDVLTRVSERTGCIVVVIHHARKPSRDSGAGGAKMAIRGSGAIFDACGSVLVFEADKGEPTRVSHEKARVTGRLVEDFELSTVDVEIGNDPRAGVLVTANAAKSREDAADDVQAARRRARTDRLMGELRALFEREPEQRGADAIAATLGRKASDVRQILKVMVERGDVEQTGTNQDRRHRWLGRSA